MSKSATQLIIMALILIIAQAVVFDNICLFGVGCIFAFIYIILRLPINLNRNWVLTIAFFLGLTVDIFANTQGMNALACTVLGASRRALLRLYLPRDEELADALPGISSLGAETYFKYALTSSVVYCSIIFIIEAFSLFNFAVFVLRILFSSVLTTLLLMGIDCLTLRRDEKRL